MMEIRFGKQVLGHGRRRARDQYGWRLGTAAGGLGAADFGTDAGFPGAEPLIGGWLARPPPGWGVPARGLFPKAGGGTGRERTGSSGGGSLVPGETGQRKNRMMPERTTATMAKPARQVSPQLGFSPTNPGFDGCGSGVDIEPLTCAASGLGQARIEDGSPFG